MERSKKGYCHFQNGDIGIAKYLHALKISNQQSFKDFPIIVAQELPNWLFYAQ